MSMDEENDPANDKKIRFKTPLCVLYKADNKIEESFRNDKEPDEVDSSKKDCLFGSSPTIEPQFSEKTPSLASFLQVELTRDYLLENDEERFSARREKVYSFIKIPQELESFMRYGFMQCTDSFLFVYTFLPMRIVLALWNLVTTLFSKCFGLRYTRNRRILTPAEICDLLKAVILVICSTFMLSVDTSILYHLIKSQSVIKLYIFYNMLEVSERLFSVFGQDTIDALFSTATEPRGRKREHLRVIAHLVFAIVYVVLHSILVLFQAATLNVAINSNNKTLLSIMLSNNFIELKGSVFKKFDKNNLFQVSCSDVRERFHHIVLLSIVGLLTMREYSWKSDHLWVLVPDCLMVLVVEVIVDWVKHAFITRFNELPLDVYTDYSTSFAYDMAQTRQRHAFSDHSDLVARRMGFMPLPLGVVMIRVLVSAIRINDIASIVIFFMAYVCLFSFKILNGLLILGKACDLITQHKHEVTTQSPFSGRTTTSPRRPPIVEQPRGSPYGNGFPVPQIKSATLHNDLGTAAIFANNTVDLKNVSLNKELLKVKVEDIKIEPALGEITRSFPCVSRKPFEEEIGDESLKRGESEPLLLMSNSEE